MPKKTIPKQNVPKIKLTQEGYDKFQALFDKLTKERPEVLERLQAAREMGDLSENGAYHAAKFELGNIDRQLRKLTYQLRYAEITETKKSGTADFGSTIKLDNNGKEMTFMLVSGYESDPKEGKLSVYSPIGKAVVGKKAGDEVIVDAPAGKLTLKLVSVS